MSAIETRKELSHDEIKESVSIFRLLTQHYDCAGTLMPVADGGGFAGTCPVCKSSKGEPFRIGADGRSWFCMAVCFAGGDVLDLVATTERVDVATASALLIEWFNLNRPALVKEDERPTNQNGSASKSGKGYMRDFGIELKKRIESGNIEDAVRFAKATVLESYRNGQKVEKVSA